METLNFEKMPSAMMQVLERLGRIEMMLMKPTETPKPQRFDFNGTLDYLKGLGYTIGDSKLQKLTASGKIPCSKFNNRLVFEKSALDAWVQSQTVQVGNNSEAADLTLAKSANRKLRGGRGNG